MTRLIFSLAVLAVALIVAPAIAQTDLPPAPVFNQVLNQAVDVVDTAVTLPAPPPEQSKPASIAAGPAAKAMPAGRRSVAKTPPRSVCGPGGCNLSPAFCGPGGCPAPASCASGNCAAACPTGNCGSFTGGHYSRRGWFGGGRLFGRRRR